MNKLYIALTAAAFFSFSGHLLAGQKFPYANEQCPTVTSVIASLDQAVSSSGWNISIDDGGNKYHNYYPVTAISKNVLQSSGHTYHLSLYFWVNNYPTPSKSQLEKMATKEALKYSFNQLNKFALKYTQDTRGMYFHGCYYADTSTWSEVMGHGQISAR